MNTTSTTENTLATELPPVAHAEQTSIQTPTPAGAKNPADEAVRNVIVGALWCIGGIVVTAVTYNAVKDTGGTYFVAYGAILFGGVQFLKGLFQLGK